MNVVLFEDQRVEQLYPITLPRPAYVVTVGGARLVDVVAAAGLKMTAAVVRPHLAALQVGVFGVNASRIDPRVPTLWINARIVPHYALAARLGEFCQSPERRVAKQNGDIVLALTETPPSLPAYGEIEASLNSLQLPSSDSAQLPLLAYPHDVIRQHLEIFDANLQALIQNGGYQEIRKGVFAAEGTPLADQVVTNTQVGPIVLEEGVHIQPLSYLSGPILLGTNATVLAHTAIAGYVSCGRKCKLGGEITESIVESYTNKQHHGFLGHAYVGSWVNLGAGTSNSDLKNTYGSIRMQYGDLSVDTNMQFLGCIVGDYVKTAINSSIFTGRTIGVCSMIYGTASTNVPSFVNYARDAGQVKELPCEVAITTQRRTFGRRDITHRPEHEQLLRDMFTLTQAERNSSTLPVTAGKLTL